MPHRKSTFETIFQMAGMFVIYAIQVPLWNHMNQVGYDWLIQSLGDRGFFEAEASMILYVVPNIKYWPLSYQLYYCSFQICCHLLLSPSITVMLLSHVDISSTRERDDATKELCVNERRFTLGHRLSSCVNITRLRCDISAIAFYCEWSHISYDVCIYKHITRVIIKFSLIISLSWKHTKIIQKYPSMCRDTREKVFKCHFIFSSFALKPNVPKLIGSKTLL